MYCENCGKYIREDDAFCEQCGTKNRQYNAAPANINANPMGQGTDKTKVIIVVVVFAVLILATVIGIIMVKKTKDNNQSFIEEIEAIDNITSNEDENEVIQPEEPVYPEETEDVYMEDSYSSNYIIPDSDTRYISESELYSFSAWECRVARNEIYARHGRIFKDDELSDYFYSKDWYYPSIDPDDFSESMLNKYEKKNTQVIAEYEKAMGYK